MEAKQEMTKTGDRRQIKRRLSKDERGGGNNLLSEEGRFWEYALKTSARPMSAPDGVIRVCRAIRLGAGLAKNRMGGSGGATPKMRSPREVKTMRSWKSSDTSPIQRLKIKIWSGGETKRVGNRNQGPIVSSRPEDWQEMQMMWRSEARAHPLYEERGESNLDVESRRGTSPEGQEGKPEREPLNGKTSLHRPANQRPGLTRGERLRRTSSYWGGKENGLSLSSNKARRQRKERKALGEKVKMKITERREGDEGSLTVEGREE